jgi:hypothetical protein
MATITIAPISQRAQIINAVRSGEIKPNYILSVSSDPKTIKSLIDGVLTGVMYGMPANGSGEWNDCPYASLGCTMACLNTSGHGGIGLDQDNLNPVQIARLKRSAFFHTRRSEFWTMLIRDIDRLIRKARKLGLKPAVRLNGTTDVKWESTPVVIDNVKIANNIMELYPDLVYYDYTKWPYAKRPNESLPINYHLTFSRSETNENQIADNISHGRNVTVVVDIKSTDKSTAIPTTWREIPTHDADRSDFRPNDPIGRILILRYKSAKASSLADAIASGFVVPAFQ